MHQPSVTIVIFAVVAVLMAPAAALNFHEPSLKGGLLNYCLTQASGDGCGQPAADAWCKALGYDRVLGFTGPVLAPVGNKTIAIQSKEECVRQKSASFERTCFTFVAINCIREKLFIRPKVNGKLLDWCLDGSKGCGKPAADAFCVSQGFSHGAWAYGGPFGPIDEDTVQPKTNRSCDSKRQKCRAFANISCEK